MLVLKKLEGNARRFTSKTVLIDSYGAGATGAADIMSYPSRFRDHSSRACFQAFRMRSSTFAMLDFAPFLEDFCVEDAESMCSLAVMIKEQRFTSAQRSLLDKQMPGQI